MNILTEAEVKKCTSCRREFPLSGFHLRKEAPDGRRAKCKACQNKLRNKWRNSEKGQAAVSRYNKSEKGIATVARLEASEQRKKSKKEYAELNKEKAREANRKHSRNNREKLNKKAKEWAINNQKKVRAYNKVEWAKFKGRLVGPNLCEKCNTPSRLSAHHDDYDHPLIVRWLCPKCHKRWHMENGEGKNAHT
jgi:ribosomal protein S27AE